MTRATTLANKSSSAVARIEWTLPQQIRGLQSKKHSHNHIEWRDKYRGTGASIEIKYTSGFKKNRISIKLHPGELDTESKSKQLDIEHGIRKTHKDTISCDAAGIKIHRTLLEYSRIIRRANEEQANLSQFNSPSTA